MRKLDFVPTVAMHLSVCSFLPEIVCSRWTVLQFANFLNIQFRSIDTAGWRPINVPKGPFLCVQDFSLLFVPFLVHFTLGFSLHENVFPLPTEHFLQSRQVLRFVIRQLQTSFVLHGTLTQIHSVVCIFRSPVLRRPIVRSLQLQYNNNTVQIMQLGIAVKNSRII